jgi:sigma-B regulation protein RsbU (phosphoserine phosphatase)
LKQNTHYDNPLIDLLLKRQAELNSLLEVTQAINSNSSSHVLFEMLRMVLKVHLKIGKMRLMIKEGEHFYCAAKFGGVYESESELQEICHNLDHLKDIRALSDPYNILLSSYDFSVPVLHKDNMLAFVLIGDCNMDPEFHENDLNFVQTLINVIVVALENKKLFKERMHRELLQRDIKLAIEVQNMLVPLHMPNDNSFEIGALYLPSQNISGDYFDFIRLNDHEFLWCIADVSGKGVAAALLMATLQATIRAAVSADCDLVDVVTRLNHVIVSNTNGERFITLFLAKYDQENREMQYINAGHHPSVLLMNDEAVFLRHGTTILGAFDELPFVNTQCIKLSDHSLIFNYTDGLVESADEDVFIAEEELVEYLKDNQYLQVDDLNENVLKDIRSSRKANMNTDDITLLSMKIF